VFRIAVPFVIFAASLVAGEPAAQDNSLPVYSDPVGGYSFLVPSGYKKLTAEQNRQVFDGLSKFIGKDIADRAERNPPAYFNGPVDPKRPTSAPPSLAVGYTELDAPIDPSQLPEYRQQIEQELKKRGDKHSELKLDVVKVNGINSLRLEHDVYSPIDNSRSRIIRVSVPGDRRRYDIVFNFHPDQVEGVEQSLAVVLDQFRIDKHQVVNAESQSKWTRIALWTVGCFVGGIVLSLLLKMLAGVGEKEPEESGG